MKNLAIKDIKVLKFARFCDNRGYFTENYRAQDLEKELGLQKTGIKQINESQSKKNTIRGLHFQWNPYMGKLVRTVSGHMIDLVLDIRLKSPTLGKIIAYDMPAHNKDNYNEWIWIPPGFAHGNLFLENTKIEYLCTGIYSPNCEAGISPLSKDLDWSLCSPKMSRQFNRLIRNSRKIISEKDLTAINLTSWLQDKRAKKFNF